jgi:hypothetical protein
VAFDGGVDGDGEVLAEVLDEAVAEIVQGGPRN